MKIQVKVEGPVKLNSDTQVKLLKSGTVDCGDPEGKEVYLATISLRQSGGGELLLTGHGASQPAAANALLRVAKKEYGVTFDGYDIVTHAPDAYPPAS